MATDLATRERGELANRPAPTVLEIIAAAARDPEVDVAKLVNEQQAAQPAVRRGRPPKAKSPDLPDNLE